MNHQVKFERSFKIGSNPGKSVVRTMSFKKGRLHVA